MESDEGNQQMTNLGPAEYGRYLASLQPPITDAQAEAAARILASAAEGVEMA